jgi:hypothetical protein
MQIKKLLIAAVLVPDPELLALQLGVTTMRVH